MDPHLGELQQQIADAVSGLDVEQLTWHVPGKWSVAEILEHLYLTYTGTIKGCGRLLAADKLMVSGPTLKNRMQSLIVVGLGYMPSGRKSPEVARPRGLAADKVAGEVEGKIREMDAALAQVAGRFGTRAKVLDHPLLGPFSVGQWRKFHLVHGLHHVKQIRRLREQLPSPASQAALAEK